MDMTVSNQVVTSIKHPNPSLFVHISIEMQIPALDHIQPSHSDQYIDDEYIKAYISKKDGYDLCFAKLRDNIMHSITLYNISILNNCSQSSQNVI